MTETRANSIHARQRILDDEKKRRELEKLAAIAFPKEAADAMRQMGRILGEGRDAERRRRLMDSIEGFIKRGEWPLLELADIPLLWHPNNPEKQSALLAKMKTAIEAGELIPMVGQGFTATHLSNWKDAPPIPINSPMIHFLPAWMEREGQREPQAPESAGSEKPRPPVKATGSTTRINQAIAAGLIAYRARHHSEPTADSLFDWLAEHDETGTVEDSNDENLWWKKSDGGLKKISRKAIANQLTGIKAKNPG